MSCEESLEKINKCDLELFRNGSVHEFYRLKELIKLEQVNTSEKKESSLAKANWSGVVYFYCVQMSLVMSMRFNFGDDLNDMPYSHHDVIYLEFSCNYTRV